MTLQVNLLRRGFDSGKIDFERPSEPTKYQQLSFKTADFESPPGASDAEVRQLIVHTAYWLGYRFSNDPRNYRVQFDSPIDLNYLGVSQSNVRRNVWLLDQEGLLQNTDLPGLGAPTGKLIRQYESDLAEKNIGVPPNRFVVPPAQSIGIEGVRSEVTDKSLLTASLTPKMTTEGTRPSGPMVEAALRALSDKPSLVDLLDFTDYAQALIDLIQNPKTQTPLTIGVDGAWGSGKTTLMRMMQEKIDRKRIGGANDPNSHTVWFNAWKYDREDSLWAALALEILRQVRKQLRTWDRVKLWAALNYKRLDNRSVLNDLGKSVLYPACIVVVSLLCIRYWTRWINPATNISKWSALTLGGGALSFLALAVKKIYNKVIAPFELNISEYVRTPDYKERVGFLGEFEADFKYVVETVTHSGESSLIVFIDDLDRCEPTKPVEVIEAINHLLDADHCVFIIGMDARAVAASVEAKYKPLQDFVRNDDGAARAVGYSFLEKIIQIPFRLPRASHVLLTKLVDGNLDPQPGPGAETKTSVSEAERLIAKGEKQGKTLEAAAASVKRARPDISTAAVTEAKRNIYARTFDDDVAVRKAIYDVIPYLGQNARKVKRFINLFRLNILIANRRGLLERNAVQVSRLSIWLVIILCWPDFADLATDRGFLSSLWAAHRLWESFVHSGTVSDKEGARTLLAPYLEDPRIKRFVSTRQLFTLLRSFLGPGAEFESVAESVLPYAELAAVTLPLGGEIHQIQ